ncbi:hypothetical protein, partial [Lactiplantibacillus plantarum]|uniref:hypothetical protein n=1 Tax=Lactiplantibacillus plantarum TaxID=1590 RepID=UPI002F268DB0
LGGAHNDFTANTHSYMGRIQILHTVDMVDHRHHATDRRLEDCYVMASVTDHCCYMLLLAV